MGANGHVEMIEFEEIASIVHALDAGTVDVEEIASIVRALDAGMDHVSESDVQRAIDWAQDALDAAKGHVSESDVRRVMEWVVQTGVKYLLLTGALEVTPGSIGTPKRTM